MKQIQYTPMFEMVLDTLRDSVVTGAWKPGELLSHEDLAGRLNVSRMPVREAVRLLEQEGFVTIRRNVGVEVNPLSWEDFEEIYLMRQALESLAGRLAATRFDDGDIDDLKALTKKLEASLVHDKQNVSATLKLTQQFHTAVYRPAGKAKLLKTIDTLRHHSTRYRAFVVQLPGRGRQLYSEHLKIYEACERRDPVAVAQALSDHFEQALKLARAEKGRIGAAEPGAAEPGGVELGGVELGGVELGAVEHS